MTTDSRTNHGVSNNDLTRPRLRPIEAFGVDIEGRNGIALRDARSLTDHVAVITPEALPIVQRFTGEFTVREIADECNADPDSLRALVDHLDHALLLYSDQFDAVEQEMLSTFDALERLPVRSAAEFTADKMDAALSTVESEEWLNTYRSRIAGTNRRIAGLVTPHLDFDRGRRNYARGFAALRAHLESSNQSGPDRVVVLGTNHRGLSTGVLMCPIGQATPVGDVAVESDLVQLMSASLGSKLTRHRLDTIQEHSIELQLPWIRYLLGDVPATGFLIHDPLFADGASYDGHGVALDDFITTLTQALTSLGGETLFVASADLSHAGREFGDEEPNTSQRLHELEHHDRSHLEYLTRNQLDEFLASMKTGRNRTRWCTLGGMTALWRMLAPACSVDLISYEQATVHPITQSTEDCCVTSAAMALTI